MGSVTCRPATVFAEATRYTISGGRYQVLLQRCRRLSRGGICGAVRLSRRAVTIEGPLKPSFGTQRLNCRSISGFAVIVVRRS
jgi:hypothetical protein